jgi:spoIIIJ-associated protein
MSEHLDEDVRPVTDIAEPATDGHETVIDPIDPIDPTTSTTVRVEAETDADAAVTADAQPEGAAESNSEGSAASGRSARRAHLEREGEVAADFLETLLDICDLDGDLDVDVDGDRAAVAVVDSDEGRVPRRLVGQNGQVLEALQDLTRLAVQAGTGERSRLMLDVAGHRAERRAFLVEVAGTAIAEVRSTGESKSLTPMTAFERKVVHDQVLAAGLSSESEGAEPRRFVVILPA